MSANARRKTGFVPLRLVAIWLAIASVTLPVSAVAGEMSAPDVASMFPDPIVTTLTNGLRLYHIPKQPGPELAEVCFYVPVGAMDESPSQAGISHLLEHLIFSKPAVDGQPLGDWFDQWSIGYNAFTSPDSTVYFSPSVPIDMLGETLEQWSRALMNPAPPDERLFYRERGVVSQEIYSHDTGTATDIDTNEEILVLLRALWRGWMPAVDPAGFSETVEDLTPEHVRAYQQKWYRPDRMFVIIAANLPHDDVVHLVNQSLGRAPLPNRPLPRRHPVPDPTVDTFTFIPLIREVQDVKLMMMTAGPRRDSKQHVALALLKSIVNIRSAQHPDPRFEVVTDNAVFGENPKSSIGLIEVQLTQNYTEYETYYPLLEEHFMSLLESITARPPTAAEVDMARNAWLLDKIRSPSMLLIAALQANSPAMYHDGPRWCAELTPEDIQRAAAETFDLNRSVLLVKAPGRSSIFNRVTTDNTSHYGLILLPAIMFLALHFAWRRWLSQGVAMLYIVRSLSRGNVLLVRLATLQLTALAALAALTGLMQIMYWILGVNSELSAWKLIPWLGFTVCAALAIHAGLELLIRRQGWALALSLALLIAGNLTMNLRTYYQTFDEQPGVRAALRWLYLALPKYDHIRYLANHAALGTDIETASYFALIQLTLFSLAALSAGIWAFNRTQFSE